MALCKVLNFRWGYCNGTRSLGYGSFRLGWVGDLFGITEDPACCGGGEGMGIGFVVKGDGRRTPILELAALGDRACGVHVQEVQVYYPS